MPSRVLLLPPVKFVGSDDGATVGEDDGAGVGNVGDEVGKSVCGVGENDAAGVGEGAGVDRGVGDEDASVSDGVGGIVVDLAVGLAVDPVEKTPGVDASKRL